MRFDIAFRHANAHQRIIHQNVVDSLHIIGAISLFLALNAGVIFEAIRLAPYVRAFVPGSGQ